MRLVSHADPNATVIVIFRGPSTCARLAGDAGHGFGDLRFHLLDGAIEPFALLREQQTAGMPVKERYSKILFERTHRRHRQVG